MDKIRIGVVGTGFGVRVQIPGFRESGRFEVTAIVSNREKRAHEVASALHIPHAFTDHREMLGLEDVDAVSVASTPDLHLSMVRDALAAGKHVLCEKPLARNLEEAREMAACARQSPLVAMIDHEFRWQPARALVKELLEQGYVGTPWSVTAVGHVSLFADPERPAYSWWQQRERGAGWLLNSGTHLIDTLRWWLGDVEAVAGFVATNVKQRKRARDGALVPVDADDGFGALLRFRSGVQGVLHQSGTAAVGRTNRVQICGSAGVLMIDDQDRVLGARRGDAEPRVIEVPRHLRAGAPFAAWGPSGEQGEPAGGDGVGAAPAGSSIAGAALARSPTAAPANPGRAAAPAAAFTQMEIPPFICLALEFAAAIDAGATREPSIVDAARTQEVCEAIERSSREGRWLELPLD